MNESNYKTYDYYTRNIQENTQNSLNKEELNYNIINNKYISNTRTNISKPNTTLGNKYATR